MTYLEKLQDPRWQKKRLEILERDNWTCFLCKDKETTFHIHHIKYAKEPWESPNENLITYCKHCHSVIEYNKKQESVTPIRIIKTELVSGSMQLHFIYRDEQDDIYLDIYVYDKKGGLEYKCSISDCTLYWINDVVFKKAEAP